MVSLFRTGSLPSITPAALNEIPRRSSAFLLRSSTVVSGRLADRGRSVVSIARCSSAGFSPTAASNSRKRVVPHGERGNLPGVVNRLGRRRSPQCLPLIRSARRRFEQPGMPAQRFAGDQYRDCAVPPRVGHFDGAPRVNRVSRAIEHRPGVVFLRLMVEDEHNLSRHVDVRVVVVSVFRRGNPVSGKYHRRADPHFVLESAADFAALGTVLRRPRE